ncbi:hypothetical protein OROHE_023955 [Orobanche hederae]
MGLKVAPASLHWSQPPSSSSFSRTSSSASSKISSSLVRGDGGALFCRSVHKSALFMGAHHSTSLPWSRSCGNRNSRVRIIKRASTFNLDSFSDEEFSRKIQELALRFQPTEVDHCDCDGSVRMDADSASDSDAMFLENLKPTDEIVPADIERKANSVDIPLSIGMTKQRKQGQEGIIMEVGESACCSVKKAFSSMVFIIRELHSYTLQMREILFYEDLQGILVSVQKEMQASFVWLFQKVFSHTPTLMMYLMLLLANYTVYSMSTNAAIAATPPAQEYGATTNTEQLSVAEDHDSLNHEFDSSIVGTLKFSSSYGKEASLGGNNGGGKYRPIGGGTDGDGRFGESNYGRVSPVPSHPWRISGDESVSRRASVEEEESLWNSMVEDAFKMQDASRDEALDHETTQRFISPVDAKIETDERSEYLKTELLYQTELTKEPNNPLLLANYAQFIYLVAQDFDRAEEYFQRATKVEPKDAEALNKYANFLWVVRNDVWAAEETYLEAISTEPENPYYAANYAHFLWNTGGEDTCFPLSSPDSSIDE